MRCEHDYRVLDSNIETEIMNYLDDDNEIILSVKGYATFYCSKCLTIEKKVIV